MDITESTALADLVREAQRGRDAAQRALVARYQQRMAGFAYAITGRSDTVEDLAQIIFIKMFRALGRLDDPERFEAWLFRLARNSCIDHLRREKWRRFFTPIEDEHETIAETNAPVDSAELDAIRHALQQLKPKDRVLIALAQEGRSQNEMAEITHTSVSAIKARLHRAREQLRKIYEHDA
jgi:RNA polymerase sigma-70 factor (ECF subfamily)